MVLIPESGRFPWRRAWQPTSVFLPGESPGQESLMGHSPQGRRESDTTEHTLLFFFSLAVNNPAWTLVLMVLDVSFLGFFLCCSHVWWYPPILYSSFDSPRCVVGWRPFERWLFFSLLFSGSPFSAHFREMLCYDQQSRSFWHCFSLAGWGRGELGANHYLWKVWVRWGKKKVILICLPFSELFCFGRKWKKC